MSKIPLPHAHRTILRTIYTYLNQLPAPHSASPSSITALAGTQPSLKLGDALLRHYKHRPHSGSEPRPSAGMLPHSPSAVSSALSPTSPASNALNTSVPSSAPQAKLNSKPPAKNSSSLTRSAQSAQSSHSSELSISSPKLAPPATPTKGTTLTKAPLSPLAALHQTIATCTQCKLHERRQNPPPLNQTSTLPIMVLLDIVNWSDQLHGKVFTTQDGELLLKILGALGLKYEDIYVTTAIKCSSVEEISNQLKAIQICINHFHEELHLLKPELIIAFGEDTYRLLTQRSDFDTLFNNHSKNNRSPNNLKPAPTQPQHPIHQYKGVDIVYTHHPKELVNEPPLKQQTWEQLKPLRTRIEAIKRKTQ